MATSRRSFIAGLPFLMLRHLAPTATGHLATYVKDILREPDRLLTESALYRAYSAQVEELRRGRPGEIMVREDRLRRLE